MGKITVSAHVFRVKEFEGRVFSHLLISNVLQILPEAKWNSVVDAFALTEKMARKATHKSKFS